MAETVSHDMPAWQNSKFKRLDPLEATPRTTFENGGPVSKARRFLQDLAHDLKWRVAVSPGVGH
jgi:hypothetical protein